jgi:hypothetical protein
MCKLILVLCLVVFFCLIVFKNFSQCLTIDIQKVCSVTILFFRMDLIVLLDNGFIRSSLKFLNIINYGKIK